MALKPVEILITARDTAKGVIDKLRQSTSGLSKSLRGVKTAANQAEQAEKNLEKAIKSLETAADQSTAAEKNLSKAKKELAAASKNAQIAQKKQAEATQFTALHANKAQEAQFRLTRAQDSLASASKTAQLTQNKLTKAIKNEAEAVKQAEAATKRIKAEQDKLSNSNKKLSNSFKTAAVRIGAFVAAAVGLRKIKDGFLEIINTGARFEILNKQLAAVMGTVEGGQAAFAWIEDFQKNTKLQLEDVTKAFVRMKAFGLDPMDGTMQKLVDANAKLGGSQETLNGIILAVGQAWTKQKLQAEEANQLIERGIPVWNLLAESLGKTTAEVIEMSTAGAIGQKEIAGLIDAIGDSATGAAADQMKTLTGLTSNLSDTWTRFLNTIAKSGILDHVKGQLQDLSDTIQGMAEDGSLQQWARDISETFVAVSDVIGIFSDSIRIAFNSVQVAVTGVLDTLVNAAADVNAALATITFGDTSAEFQKNADNMRLFSEQLRLGVTEDVEQIKASYDSIAEKFTSTGTVAKSTADVVVKAEQDKAKAAKDSSDQIIAANEAVQESQKQTAEAAEQAARKAAAAAQAQAEASRGALIQQQAQAAAAIDAENSAHVARQRSILQSQQLQQQQAEASEQQASTTQESASQADALTSIITRLKDRVAEYGDAWVDVFNKQQVTFEGEGGAFFFERLEKSFTNTINIARQFNEEIQNNAQSLQFMAEGGAASSVQLEIMRDLLQESLKDADKLSKASLDQLKSSIAAANDELGRMSSLADSAASKLGSLQDEWDRLNDNQSAIDQRRLQQQRLEIETQLQAARDQGNEQAILDLQESLSLLTRINQKKQQNNALDAANNAAQPTANPTSTPSATPAPPAPAPTTRTVNIEFVNGNTNRTLNAAFDSQNEADEFLELLKQTGSVS